ncbi:MAG: hypothetical protein LBM17_04605 [Candidatus Accumulibacter sp.]|jgi:hypothetical protein|nr:hypothetical protein [Accumulibacter sp.]
MPELSPHPDPEINDFEQSLIRSIEQMKRGEYGRISTPEDIDSLSKPPLPLSTLPCVNVLKKA